MGFVNFHGMVCHPKTAAQCIDSFTGTILFMPSDYTPSSLASFDCSAKGVLTPVSYYMLVLFSLTGLSTLLGMTKVVAAKEYPTTAAVQGVPLASDSNTALRVEKFVLDYCKQYTNANSIFLKRRFEYKFRLVGLEVIMLHFLCDQDKLHLVEVYEFNNIICRKWVAPFLVSFGKFFRNSVVSRQQKQSKAQKAV